MGAQRLAVVVAPSKQEIMRHFGKFTELRDRLLDRGKDAQAKKVARVAEVIDAVAVTQDAPLGLDQQKGH